MSFTLNALLAGLLVTSSFASLLAKKKSSLTLFSKLGLLIYAAGTFAWSLKGLQTDSYSLMFISISQTVLVLTYIWRSHE